MCVSGVCAHTYFQLRGNVTQKHATGLTRFSDQGRRLNSECANVKMKSSYDISPSSSFLPSPQLLSQGEAVEDLPLGLTKRVSPSDSPEAHPLPGVITQAPVWVTLGCHRSTKGQGHGAKQFSQSSSEGGEGSREGQRSGVWVQQRQSGRDQAASPTRR